MPTPDRPRHGSVNQRAAPLTIHPLNADHLDRLFTTVTRPFGETWLARQARDEVYVAVAELDGTPVGRVGLDFTRLTSGEAVHLWAAHVDPLYQSRGIGTALIAHVEALARTRGYRSIQLDVGKDNPRAHALYLRLGYKVFDEGTERWTYRDDSGRDIEVVEDCWRMRKPLS
jgi:ribosomal protein S18 acetylase RimI-like enzyme